MRFAPEIYTDQVTESRNFYCNNLNFKVKQETDGFIVIEHAENRAYQLLFCQPNSPFINKIFHPKFNGEGIIFQMEVDNIEQEYQRIKKLKKSIKKCFLIIVFK